ncbi:hypothetical protein [Sediminibacterium soli]|uniref:hypothetical protein n=1 Tax=Sediminibacterium soli TaxID=2698829 RepID=UPI00137A1E7E|nr:hypothetical protein [Sediminibacterium soli]NCI46450.1 hypothetical protein [Sediminibacterium soli]
MKQVVFLLIVLVSGAATAQTKQAAVQKTQTVKSVATEGTLAGFETVLSDGKILFSKKLSWSSPGSAPAAAYFLETKNSSFNNGKPFAVSLNKDAFDSYFQKSSPELNQKWAQLTKFMQDRRLSYTDEEGWIKAINYLNSIL